MFGNGRKTIGVFVTRIFNESQDNICRGICRQAKDFGYNVALFSKFDNNTSSKFFNQVEDKMAYLPDYSRLDGIILISSATTPNKFEEYVKQNIENCSCPVVTIRKEEKGRYNVSVNHDIILEEIIRHFIEYHGYQKINFLAGPKDSSVSNRRVDNFLRVMEEHGLEVKDEQIYYGDFLRSKAYNAAMEWMPNPEKRPEAIICANDYMAITLCWALSKMGFEVPKDVAVSGCDNIGQSQDFIPSITTVGQPLFEMGLEAVKKIHRHLNNIQQEMVTYLPGKTYIRESCGCNVKVKKANL